MIFNYFDENKLYAFLSHRLADFNWRVGFKKDKSGKISAFIM